MHDGHEHTHSHGLPDKSETLAALRFMLRHNEHHTEELRELAHDLTHLDMESGAAGLLECAAAYENANAKLAEVLKGLEE